MGGGQGCKNAGKYAYFPCHWHLPAFIAFMANMANSLDGYQIYVDMDWSVDRQCEVMLDWSNLGFLAAGSVVGVDGSVETSSSGSGRFWEGLLAGHFSLWTRSRGASALTTALQSMQLTLVLLSCSTTAKKFQIGSFSFTMVTSTVVVVCFRCV